MSKHLKIKSSNIGLFGNLLSGFQTEPKLPYATPYLNYTYDLLFCDKPLAYKNEMTISAYPWDVIYSHETGDYDKIKAISRNALIESRPRLIASKILNEAGIDIIEQELLGIIVELHHKNQFDVLAAYGDNSLYFIHHNQRLFNNEYESQKNDDLVSKLFNYGNGSLNTFYPRLTERTGAPSSGNARISLLCTDGVYVREGLYNQLKTDLQTGTIIETAVQLMLNLTEQRQRQNKRDYGKMAS